MGPASPAQGRASRQDAGHRRLREDSSSKQKTHLSNTSLKAQTHRSQRWRIYIDLSLSTQLTAFVTEKGGHPVKPNVQPAEDTLASHVELFKKTNQRMMPEPCLRPIKSESLGGVCR